MKQQREYGLPLLWRLTALITACWLVLLMAALALTLRFTLQTKQAQTENILMSAVITLANGPEVRRALERGYCDEELVDYLTDVVVNTDDLEYITIADRDSIRLYHIDPSFVGLPFEGGDQHRALAGESYLSDAGTENFSRQRRAFHPVRDDAGAVIGFVMASATHHRESIPLFM